MSDHWITLVPEDPRFIPDLAKQNTARDRFAEIAPEVEEIELIASDEVKFFDCGENFSHVCCPSCHSEIPLEWWTDRMDEDSAPVGFKLKTYSTPCCGKNFTLNELVYRWTQAFGCFALDAMNPDIGELQDGHKRELEELLGTKLKVIYQHI
jgi:hypothetical protein